MIKRTRKPVSRQTRRFESRSIRRRFNEAEGNDVFYKAGNATFESFETSYEDGQLDYVNEWDEKCSCRANTLQELLDEVKSKLYMEDEDYYWSVDVEGSALRVSYLGNDDGYLASKSEVEEWKNGELMLYNIDGFISVQKVMGEIDVPESELEALARANKMDIM